MHGAFITKAAALVVSALLILSVADGYPAGQDVISYKNSSACDSNKQASSPYPEDGSLSGKDRAVVYENYIISASAVILRTSGGTGPALADIIYLNVKNLGLGLIFLLILITSPLTSTRILSFIHESDGMK